MKHAEADELMVREVSPLVNGFSRNSHQSFGSLAEAEEVYQRSLAAKKREESPGGSDKGEESSVDGIRRRTGLIPVRNRIGTTRSDTNC